MKHVYGKPERKWFQKISLRSIRKYVCLDIVGSIENGSNCTVNDDSWIYRCDRVNNIKTRSGDQKIHHVIKNLREGGT